MPRVYLPVKIVLKNFDDNKEIIWMRMTSYDYQTILIHILKFFELNLVMNFVKYSKKEIEIL